MSQDWRIPVRLMGGRYTGQIQVISREKYNCQGQPTIHTVMSVQFILAKLQRKPSYKTEKVVGLINQYSRFYIFKDHYVFKLFSTLATRKFPSQRQSWRHTNKSLFWGFHSHLQADQLISDKLLVSWISSVFSMGCGCSVVLGSHTYNLQWQMANLWYEWVGLVQRHFTFISETQPKQRQLKYERI